MVHLIFRDGRPYLFGPTWKTLLVPNDWLYSLRSDGATLSPRTWRSYAYGLGDHLAWCDREQLDWQLLGRVDLDRYIGSLATSDESINHRITLLARFYQWCEEAAVILRTPFAFRTSSVRRTGFLGTLSRDIARPSALRRIPRGEKIVVPSAANIWAVRNAADSWRDQLLIETFIFTGLRCSEVLGLEASQVCDVRLGEKESAVLVRITGKGRKTRQVPFPAGLVRNLQRYVVLDRKHVATETPRLFVSAKGKPLSASGVQFLLRAAGKKHALALHPHLLRHFFACHRLKYLTDLGLGDPLGQLQRELGHSQITTTMRYLHLTDEMRARIASDHQEFIARIAGGHVELASAWPRECAPAAITMELRASR
ncbi:MAG: tyrosine-type recombinase/integrase [Acidobacteriota bacterium]